MRSAPEWFRIDIRGKQRQDVERANAPRPYAGVSAPTQQITAPVPLYPFPLFLARARLDGNVLYDGVGIFIPCAAFVYPGRKAGTGLARLRPPCRDERQHPGAFFAVEVYRK